MRSGHVLVTLTALVALAPQAAVALVLHSARRFTTLRAISGHKQPSTLTISMLAKKTTWSVGHARKKPKKPKVKARRPTAQGFGGAAIGTASAIDDARRSPEAEPSVGEAEADGDAAALAAWRAYASAAVAAVERMEGQSDNVLELLRSESDVEEQ